MTLKKLFLAHSRGVLLAVIIAVVILLVFAFFNRQIHNDEAWIGQQVWSLEHKGKVVSELFRDCPPLDNEIVVTHKLLIWSGLVVSYLFGWGLYPLRLISFLAGLLTLLLAFRFCRISVDPKFAWKVLSILLFTPVFWLQMLEFRPESLLILCGLASYVVLALSRESVGLFPTALAGFLAGLAGLAHAFGLVFVIAGVVALLSERKRGAVVVFMSAGLVSFAPYLSGFFTNRELFLEQTIHNPLMTTSFDLHWWQPLVNLLTEHKRVLRKPEVIGLTVWFLLSLVFVNREVWRKHRFLFVYLITLALVLAASPLPKFTRYMIPLVPFMAIIVAEVWSNLAVPSTRRPKVFARVFRMWAIIFFVYGSYALIAEALPTGRRQIETNAKLAAHMDPGTLVMAPFDFVFMQQGRFTIQSWWGAERLAGTKRTLPFLENYADSLGVRYIIVDEVERDIWLIDEDNPAQNFVKYRLILSLPERHRHLFGKADQ